MGKRGISSELLIRSVYALCLLVATCTHAIPLIQHGIFWNYGGVGWVSTAFWTSLAIADPVTAACLFVRPRVGLILTSGIIGLDVIHNAIVFSDILFQPPERHLWTYTAFGLQLAFLLFVIATVRLAWPREPKIRSLKGVIARPETPVSLEDMEAAIQAGAISE
jgi:hypothetical protein